MAISLKQCKLTPKQIEIFSLMRIEDNRDLLSYYPFRYDQIESKPYSEWEEKEKVVFEGRLVTKPVNIRFGGSRVMTRFQIESEEACLEATIFNRPWMNKIALGTKMTIFAKVEGKNKITVLQYNLKPLAEQLGIQPVYPLRYKLTQKIIQQAIRKTLIASAGIIEEDIPEKYRRKYKLCSKEWAYHWIHFPQSKEEVKQALRMLKYEEFLKFHVAIQLLRKQNLELNQREGKRFEFDDVFKLANALPFHLTSDQFRVTHEVLEDLQKDGVMYRLVQGDVGCGKTVVAALALYGCCLSGHQGALLAPTEILAKQHIKSLRDILKTTTLKIEVLYSALSLSKKKEILQQLKDGEIDILVGTHAIIQEEVEFQNLGLAVADEQHRFGVGQRKKLLEKGNKVDFMLMSATPIPRTLANTLYGDMDISTIETMPVGRKKVQTKLIKENSFRKVLKNIQAQLESGHQMYVVCSAISESEGYDFRNVEQVYENLVKNFGTKFSIGQLHGKMSSDEKELIMNEFSKGKIQILVTTTVIEVGVNVINATTMIIYDAHRFGLSQLHQLRGRVQRGTRQGNCYLLTDSKDPLSLERLEVLVQESNGFEISRQDLRLRGPGDILGTRQSGLPAFLLGNLVEDTAIIEVAKADAIEILNECYEKDNKQLIEKMIELNDKTSIVMD